MRILFTADWHIGKTLYDYSLLQDQEYWAKGLFDLLQKEKIQLMLISGDLYDRAVPSAAAVSLLDWIFFTITQKLSIPVCAISGNHDSPERLQFGSKLLSKQGLYLKTAYLKDWESVSFQDAYGPLNIWFLPYTDHLNIQKDFPHLSIHSAEEAYSAWCNHNQSKIPQNMRNIVLAHGFFGDFSPQQKPAASDFLQQAKLFTSAETMVGALDLVSCQHLNCFDYAALGHLHRAQSLGNGKARYAGSPLKYSVSEKDHRKTVTILDIKEKGNLSVEEKEIPSLRDLREITGPFEGICAAAAENTQNREDYVSVRLTDQSRIVDAMQRLRDVFPHILELKFIERHTASHSPSSAVKVQTPMERLQNFSYLLTGEQLTQEQREYAQKIFHQVEKEEKSL